MFVKFAMSSRRARGRVTAQDSDGGHPGVEHPPPPPEDPPCENVVGEEETLHAEDTDTGAVAGGGGDNADSGVSQANHQEAMRTAVLEALSDPAVIRQLVAAVSSASSSSSPASASAHDGTETDCIS